MMDKQNDQELCLNVTFLGLHYHDFPGGLATRLCKPNAGGVGSVTGYGTEIPLPIHGVVKT